MSISSNVEKALKIRDGLFLAASRTCGEQYVEPFIRFRYDLKEPTGNDHDGIGRDGIKYEIKTSKVLRKTENISKEIPIVDRILFENDNAEINRLIPFAHAEKTKYDANIQNVKRDHFDELIYVLLFEDCIKVFKIPAGQIAAIPRWSDKHGRYDALGKSGQFMINKGSIGWHVENQLLDTFSYEDMLNTFANLA